MKIAIVFALCVVAALAAPADKPVVEILKSDSSISEDGYNFAFETSDGSSRSETGEVKNVGQDNEFVAVRGSYSWTDADGQVYTVNYVADENGFQPEGEHIPKAV